MGGGEPKKDLGTFRLPPAVGVVKYKVNEWVQRKHARARKAISVTTISYAFGHKRFNFVLEYEAGEDLTC